MISGSCLLRRPLDGAGELLADHRAHAAHDEGGVGHAKGHAAGRGSCPGRRSAASCSPVRCCSSTIRSRIGPLVDEVQAGRPACRSASHSSNVPSSRTWRDPLPGGNVPVVVAFRADAQPLLRLFAENGLLAAGTPHPKPFRHGTLGTLNRVGRRIRFETFTRHNGRLAFPKRT